MNLYYPEKVIILNEEKVINSIITKNVIDVITKYNISYEILSIDQINELSNKIMQLKNPFKEGKKILLITKNKGEFLKKCPGTNYYICCDYYIIDFAQNCPMECTYCILQAYLNNPFMVLYANVDDLFNELDQKLVNKSIRIGTGEFTDSLALEHISKYSQILMDYFKNKSNVILEFKTKTNYIDTFLNYNMILKNVLISYSMNALNIAKKEELKTASITERLISASKCASLGYQITLHFDPIIDYEDFEIEYKKTVDLIFTYLKPTQITYISFGAFRFMPKLYDIISQRFKTKIIYNEFIKGYDNKERYFRFKREKMFKYLISLIKGYDKNNEIKLYFCMESPEIWNDVLGFVPSSDEELGAILYNKCIKNCSNCL